MALATSDLSAEPRLPKYERGQLINGKYRLIRLLGEGGTSWVWVAENVDLAAEVAVKLIRNDLEDSTIGERLLGEARTIARLGHPGIVRVFDFGRTDQDDRFIVMELLRGESLGQRLAREGKLNPVELVQLILPVISALAAAHAEGIVHRDLKPDNIMVATAEKGVQPKLLDFGIAKFRTSELAEPKLTQVGVVVGTPSYMSPEQARGDQDLDCRSDLFALCVVIYECLAGILPFSGDVYNAVMWSIIQDDPPDLVELGLGDEGLWAIIRKGMQKNREERWQNATELGEALAGWLEEQGIFEDISNRSLRASWMPKRPSLRALRSSAPPKPNTTEEERQSLRPWSTGPWGGVGWSRFTFSWSEASWRQRLMAVSAALLLVGWLGWWSSTEGERAAAAPPPVAGDVDLKQVGASTETPRRTEQPAVLDLKPSEDPPPPAEEEPTDGKPNAKAKPETKGGPRAKSPVAPNHRPRAGNKWDPYDFGF